MSETSETHVLSVTIAAKKLPQDGMPIDFEASETERQRLAEALDLVSVQNFRAKLTARAWQRDGVRVTGDLKAVVEQTSVVTLEPLRRTYPIKFDATYVPEGSKLARIARPDEHELHIDPEGDDPPETFVGDEIDLGPLLVEYLALALDPYPRAGDERFEAVDTDPEPEAGKVSPFAKLATFKAGRKDED
ncbi:MAG: DUF177 domain-containing protein [Pseudomonadota bacterium]|nr:DUF177 domain-containing protein [Pseudomonadota bacterium]